MSETFESHIEELIARVKTLGQTMGHDVESWFQKKESSAETETSVHEDAVVEGDPEPVLVGPAVTGPLEHYSETAAPALEPTEENHAD
jgi:hypothetical protein